MKTAAGLASVLALVATSALAAPKPLSDAQLSQIVAGANHGLVGVILPAHAKASWAFQAHVMKGH